MRKIEEEEYVRTNNGLIGKLIRIERDDIDHSLKWYVFDDGKNERYINKPYITKHSKNLIDLIEEGDIVNNSLIVYKGRTASGKEKMLVGNHIIHGMSLRITDVKTILTHEQYERNCYKVKGELY